MSANIGSKARPEKIHNGLRVAIGTKLYSPPDDLRLHPIHHSEQRSADNEAQGGQWPKEGRIRGKGTRRKRKKEGSVDGAIHFFAAV